jgi:hypothetical protein
VVSGSSSRARSRTWVHASRASCSGDATAIWNPQHLSTPVEITGRFVVAPRRAKARVAGGKAGRTLAHRSCGLPAARRVLTLFLMSRALSCGDAEPYTPTLPAHAGPPRDTTTRFDHEGTTFSMAKGKRTYQPNNRRRTSPRLPPAHAHPRRPVDHLIAPPQGPRTSVCLRASAGCAPARCETSSIEPDPVAEGGWYCSVRPARVSGRSWPRVAWAGRSSGTGPSGSCGRLGDRYRRRSGYRRRPDGPRGDRGLDRDLVSEMTSCCPRGRAR